MPDRDHVNFANHDRLWDRDGLEWTTKWAAWAETKQVAQFVGRDAEVACIEGGSGTLEWLDHDGAQSWWEHAKNHFEVPGKSIAVPDEAGRTWAAHIYRRDVARLLVVRSFC